MNKYDYDYKVTSAELAMQRAEIREEQEFLDALFPDDKFDLHEAKMRADRVVESGVRVTISRKKKPTLYSISPGIVIHMGAREMGELRASVMNSVRPEQLQSAVAEVPAAPPPKPKRQISHILAAAFAGAAAFAFGTHVLKTLDDEGHPLAAATHVFMKHKAPEAAPRLVALHKKNSAPGH